MSVGGGVGRICKCGADTSQKMTLDPPGARGPSGCEPPKVCAVILCKCIKTDEPSLCPPEFYQIISKVGNDEK